MKTKIRRYARKTTSVLLSLLIMITAIAVSTITVSAWGVQSGKTVYYVNTEAWSTVYQHFWGNGWNNYEGMTQISGTGIYYRTQGSSDYIADGFNFNNSQSDSGGSAACYHWITSNVAYYGTGHEQITDLTGLNGTAKVVAMVSTDGSNSYTKTANADCVATISGVNLEGSHTSTTATSASTGGSASEATIYPAYGSSVTISGSDSGNYVYMGSSTTNSSTLPGNVNTSDQSFTSVHFAKGGSQTTYYAYFKYVEPTYTINAQAKTGNSVSTTGGTVSPTSFTNVKAGDTNTITATPKTAQNYVFVGWTSANGKVSFTSPSSTTTTFTTTGDDTIYGTFTQDTLYPVTIHNGNGDGTVNAGSYVQGVATADDLSASDYEFTGWTVSGVTLVGCTALDTTIHFTTTSAGGSVTANYTHINYIYFYGALQSNWDSAPVVTVDGSELTPYDWIASASGTAVALKNSSGNEIGGNNCNTYYIAVYRVKATKVGKKVYVFNSSGTNGEAGTIQNENGYCYYTYSNGEGDNHSGNLSPQKVNTVSIQNSGTVFDGDETINFNLTETKYGSGTAGQGAYTYTYQVINASTSAVVKTYNSATLSVVGDTDGISAGTYKFRISTVDTKTQKMTSSADSPSFTINTTPNKRTVTMNAGPGASAATSNPRTYSYNGGAATAFSSGTTQIKTGSQITLKYTLNGYYTDTGSTITSTGVSSSIITKTVSGSTVTLKFTLPDADCTVTYKPKEIMHNVSLVKRYYKDDETLISEESSAYSTISAGGVTPISTDAAPSVTDYTFWRWTLPSSGVTKASGDVDTAEEITVKATADNKTIYVDYKETLHTITFTNDGNGHVVNSNNSTITWAKVGNVTPVSITAVNNTGYEFDSWEITSVESGKTVTIGSAAATTIKTNGNATVKAKFRPVAYSISASFPANHGYLTGETGNSVTTSKSSGYHGESFTISVTLAPGYEVNTISGTGIPSTMPTPSVSGNVYTYTYTIDDSHVEATVTLKAKTPSLSDVQFRDNSTNAFPWVDKSDGDTVNHYYNQPVRVKAKTDSFAGIKYYINNAQQGSIVGYNSVAKEFDQPASLTAPNTSYYTSYIQTYTVKVEAYNAPQGISTPATTSYNFTVSVTLNNGQTSKFALEAFLSKVINNGGNNVNASYFDPAGAAQVTEYQTQRDATQTLIARGIPAYDYDANNSTDEYAAQKTTFENALNQMLSYAKLTTVYVMTKTQQASNVYVNAHVWNTNANQDWSHFLLYANFVTPDNWVPDDTYHLVYEGRIKKGNTYRYLYSFTYAGHVNMLFKKNTSASEQDVGSKYHTNEITSITNYGEYYVNVYDANPGGNNITSVTPTAFTKLDLSYKTTRSDLIFDIDTDDDPHSYSMEDILKKINPRINSQNTTVPTITGSIASDPGVDASTIQVTQLKVGSGGNAQDMLAENAEWKPRKAGKYVITYEVTIGDDARESLGASFKVIKSNVIVYVAADDVDIYIDMNNNVGTPTINFNYRLNASGQPVTSGGTEHVLPYELDLVTGSESIYKCTIKLSKLGNNYEIHPDNYDMLKIDYISVDNTKIGESTGFTFNIVDARLSGAAWFKADSTHLKTFKNISASSVTTTFRAAISGTATELSTGVSGVSGTGIITEDLTNEGDDAGIFRVLYAGYEEQSGSGVNYSVFGYNVLARANEEITVGETQYFFDKWVVLDTSLDFTAANINSATDAGYESDLNINSAPAYADSEKTYVALFKPSASTDDVIRVKITYSLNDFDTSDGNYIYDEHKTLSPATHTRTVKIKQGDTLYASALAYLNASSGNADTIDNIAEHYMPIIRSMYFDYSYKDESAAFVSKDTTNRKIEITAVLDETAHQYHINFTPASGADLSYDGYYQNSETLTTNVDDPAWYMQSGNQWKLVSTESTYKPKYGAGVNSTKTDTLYIKVEDNPNPDGTVTNTSFITLGYTEFNTVGTTRKVTHNFYIVDFCTEGNLKGGGVVFATTDGNGNYRQNAAGTNLASSSAVASFVTSVLDGEYGVEYPVQTINNTGFRYLPLYGSEDIYRYSEELGGYHYYFPATNNNTSNYGTQTLRVYSYFVTANGEIIVSPRYAEVSRYVPES